MRKIRSDFKDRTGERHITHQNYEAEIIEYINCENITIRLSDGNVLKNRNYRHLKEGRINNPYHPSVYGRGYLGEGKYKSKTNGIFNKYYTTWFSMFQRCYIDVSIQKRPTYNSVDICSEWLCLQNFAKWFENNYKQDYMDSSWQLDKDILVKGNKIYSPETCCFVPNEVNSLLVKGDSRRGEYPIGVTFNKSKGRFEANLSKGKDQIYLGTFDTELEAFRAYKTAKEEYIKEIADKWKSRITEPCYQALINYQVEITD